MAPRFSTTAAYRQYPAPTSWNSRGTRAFASLLWLILRWLQMAAWRPGFVSRQNLRPTAHVISQRLPGHLHLPVSLLLAILYSLRCSHPVEMNTSKPYGVILPGRPCPFSLSFSWNININSLFLCSCFLLQPQGTGTFSWSLCQTVCLFEGC